MKKTYDERVSLHSAGIPFLPGDVNFDGSIDSNDADIIKAIITGSTKKTPVLEVLANIDGNLRPTDKSLLINVNDTQKIRLFLDGILISDGKIVTYYDLVMTHIRKIKSYS